MNENSKPSEAEISEYLLEVIQGYSEFNLDGETIYFRHPKIIDNLKLEKFYADNLAESLKNGIQSEESILKRYVEIGVWSQNKEDEMKSLQWQWNKMNEAIQKISDPMQKAGAEKKLEGLYERLKSLESERSKLVQWSAESLARAKKWRGSFEDHLFKDANFSEKFKINYMDAIPIIERIYQLNNSKLCIHASYSGEFFEMFCLFQGSPKEIFGKTAFEMTQYQIKILSYANLIFNKIKNVEMPKSVFSDPEKIINFVRQDKNQKNTTDGIKDLKNKSIAKKGQLSAEDFLK